MTDHAGDIAGRLLGGALCPEILQRVQADRRHPLLREARRQVLIQPGPTAVARQQQGEGLVGVVGRAHLVDREVIDLGRARGAAGILTRSQALVGLQELR